MIGDKILLLTKVFYSILFLKLLIIHITKKHCTTYSLLNLLLIHGLSIGEKIFKTFFQIGFKSGGSFWEPIQIFFALKSKNPLIISKQIMIVFFPSENSYLLSFCSQFGIHWILYWSFTSHYFCPSPFPMHLAMEFKIKWWTAFKISSFHTFESIKKLIDSKKPNKSSKTIPIWSQPLP